MNQPDTRERLLDAAEASFAEHGYAATSVRMVTQRADANLAAIHYHFGDKHGLLLSTLARRIEPINAARCAALDALVADSGGLTVEGVLAAFCRPCLESAMGEGGEAVLCLLARVTSDPELHDEVVGRFFPDVLRRFLAVLQELLPALSAAELHRRFQFCIGVLIHLMLHHDALPGLEASTVDRNDVEHHTRAYVEFCRAGLRGSPA